MEEGTIIEHGSFDDLVKQDVRFSTYLSKAKIFGFCCERNIRFSVDIPEVLLVE